MRLATVLAVLFLATCAFAADVTGTWKASTQTPDGQDVQITFNFKMDGDKLTGTATGPMGDVPITDAKLTGDAIEFTVEAHDMKIVHKGTISGDEMKLKVDMGDQGMEIIAKRVIS
jgi:hypothetical protein